MSLKYSKATKRNEIIYCHCDSCISDIGSGCGSSVHYSCLAWVSFTEKIIGKPVFEIRKLKSNYIHKLPRINIEAVFPVIWMSMLKIKRS